MICRKIAKTIKNASKNRKMGDYLKSHLCLKCFTCKGGFLGPRCVIENDKIVYFFSKSDDFSQKIAESVRGVESFLTQRLGEF